MYFCFRDEFYKNSSMLIELRLFPLAQTFPFFLSSVFSNFCEKVVTCYIRDLSLSVNFLLKLAVVEVMAAREKSGGT